MRILQAIPTLGLGGAERLVASLASHLLCWGHSVAVVAQYESTGSWIEKRLASEGVELHFLGKRPGPDVRIVPRTARAIRRFYPDVVHSHSAHVLRYAIPAVAMAARCPIVHTLHNVAEYEADAPGKILQYVAFRAGVTPVAIGRAVAESLRRVYRLVPRHVIPNGIPIGDFAPPPESMEELRVALDLPPGAPTFVAVGRFMEQKNHITLLHAFASDRLRSLGAHLLLVGDGELRGALERTVLELGLGSRVRFLGNRPDVPRLLHAADVFVLASRWEGNPLSVMEAMAAGRPVVATAVGCVPELVVNGAGQLVAPGDIAGLERAMFELASDLPLARAQGAAAAAVARDRFDSALMARAYERLYRELT
jgi:glycosyltransferase involved in cell wall biosynthesis